MPPKSPISPPFDHPGVESMPTFQFYKSTLKVHEFSGASEDKIKEAIAKFK